MELSRKTHFSVAMSYFCVTSKRKAATEGLRRESTSFGVVVVAAQRLISLA